MVADEAGGIVHRLQSGGDAQALRPQSTRQGNRTAHDVGVGRGAVVETTCADGDPAAANAETGQGPVRHLGCAGGQCGPAGVDETAPVDGDAIGVGHDHLGGCAIDGDGPVEITLTGGIDLVQDGLGQHAIGQPGVGCRVVEHDAAGGHIELAIRVAAQARCAGCLDVDQRTTCTVTQNGGALVGWCRGVGNDL